MSDKRERHTGLRTHRIAQNPAEGAFADAWKRENSRPNGNELLSWMLGDGHRPGEVSARDEVVAATVIQWLGSPVGWQWLHEVIDEVNAAKE